MVSTFSPEKSNLFSEENSSTTNKFIRDSSRGECNAKNVLCLDEYRVTRNKLIIYDVAK